MPSSPTGSFNAREQRRPTSLGFGLRRVTDLRTVRPTKTVTFSDQHDRALAPIAEHARRQPPIETFPSAHDHTTNTNQNGAPGLTRPLKWTAAGQLPETQTTRPSPDNLEPKHVMHETRGSSLEIHPGPAVIDTGPCTVTPLENDSAAMTTETSPDLGERPSSQTAIAGRHLGPNPTPTHIEPQPRNAHASSPDICTRPMTAVPPKPATGLPSV